MFKKVLGVVGCLIMAAQFSGYSATAFIMPSGSPRLFLDDGQGHHFYFKPQQQIGSEQIREALRNAGFIMIEQSPRISSRQPSKSPSLFPENTAALQASSPGNNELMIREQSNFDFLGKDNLMHDPLFIANTSKKLNDAIGDLLSSQLNSTEVQQKIEFIKCKFNFLVEANYDKEELALLVEDLQAKYGTLSLELDGILNHQ